MEDRIKFGRKGEKKRLGGWLSGFVKPSGKKWKRKASKKARIKSLTGKGNIYKKMWGWFTWS